MSNVTPRKNRNLPHVIGSAFVLFTAVGHTIGTARTPSADERVVRAAMALNHPMEMAPNRSLLDFYVGNAWSISILLAGLGLLLLLGDRSRRSAAIGAVICAAMAALSAVYFPLAPAVCLGVAAVAFAVAASAITRRDGFGK